MTHYIVNYSRIFSYEMDADNMDQAAARATNFAIGMSKNLGNPVKILSIFSEHFAENTEETPPSTVIEKLVNGMRKRIDSMLE